MSILSRSAIKSAVECGDIVIDPYDSKQLNSGSYDLRLGRDVKVYKRWVTGLRYLDFPVPRTYEDCEGQTFGPGLSKYEIGAIDMKEPPETIGYTIHQKFLLVPGIMYLMHTKERVCSTKYIPVLDGKSSIGRLGIKVHLTAGYGDVGFDGQYTLEVEASGPIWVYPDMRVAQIRFHEVTGEIEDYKKSGHYVDSDAVGAVPSKAYKQIEEDGI